MTKEQLIQILKNYADKNQIDFNELVDDFSQESPENQQEFLKEVLGNTQEQEAPQMRSGGIPISKQGLYDYPLQEVLVPALDGSITMQGINYPVDAYDARTGRHLERMQPNQEYNFDTDLVHEKPVLAQSGGRVAKVDNSFVYLKNGQKISRKDFKTNYLDRVEDLNKNKYNTDERRSVVELVSEYNNLIKSQSKPKPFINNQGDLDDATGYWNRVSKGNVLNRENADDRDPRGKIAEQQIMPFSGETSGGALQYTGKVLNHLQKKGNEFLTGYYEFPGTTVNRYKSENEKLSELESFGLNAVTDPAIVGDFAGQAIMKGGKLVVKGAKAIAPYAVIVAEATAKYGREVAAIAAKYGEKGLMWVADNYHHLDKLGRFKTAVAKINSEEDLSIQNYDDNGKLIKKPSNFSINKTEKEEAIFSLKNENLQPLSKEIIPSVEKNNTEGVTRNWFENKSFPKNQNQGIIKVQGKNTTYNLSPQGNNIFKDEKGNTWKKDEKNGYILTKPVIQKTKTTPSGKNINIKDKSSIGGLDSHFKEQEKINPSYNQYLPDSNSPINVEEELSKVPGYVKQERNLTLSDLGEVNPIGTQQLEVKSNEQIPGDIDSPDKRFKNLGKFNLNAPDRAARELAFQSSQPISLPYRGTPDLMFSEIPLIDVEPLLNDVLGQEQGLLANIDLSSTTGQMYAANLKANTQKNIADIHNKVNAQNQQIQAQNQNAKINTFNQGELNRVNADKTYVDDLNQALAIKDQYRLAAATNLDRTEANRINTENNLTSQLINLPNIQIDDEGNGIKNVKLDTKADLHYGSSRSDEDQEGAIVRGVDGQQYIIKNGKGVPLGQTGKRFSNLKLIQY